jgi:leucyl-tRNA synthetase
MFMGPLDRAKAWNTKGLEGTSRFLQRVYRWISSTPVVEKDGTEEQSRLVHRLISEVGADIEGLSFNTAIAKMMEFLNESTKWTEIPSDLARRVVLILSPFAPHLGEELWEFLGIERSLAYEPWPTFDPKYLVETMIEMGVQVNGKMRGTVRLAPDAAEEAAVAAAFGDENIAKHIGDRSKLKKVIYKPGRILNLIC